MVTRRQNSRYVYSSAHALEFYYFHMDFYKASLHLNFCDKAYIRMDY